MKFMDYEFLMFEDQDFDTGGAMKGIVFARLDAGEEYKITGEAYDCYRVTTNSGKGLKSSQLVNKVALEKYLSANKHDLKPR